MSKRRRERCCMGLRRVAPLCALLAAVVSACSDPAPPSARTQLRIVTGLQSGSFAAAGAALADVYRAALPDVEPEVLSITDGLQAFEMLDERRAEIEFTFANVAYGASVDQVFPGQRGPFTGVRAVALLQRATLHFLAGPLSPVHAVEDLRGRRAGFGSRAGAAVTVNLVLNAFGLDPARIQSRASIDEDLDALLAGRLDALFVLGTQPSASVQRAVAGGARLLPLQGSAMEQLFRQYPFYSGMVVPAGVYQGLRSPVVTIGLNGVLICRGDLDEDLVYRLTKALYEGPAGSPAGSALGQWLDISVGAATPIPLHAGAARYYRERELSP